MKIHYERYGCGNETIVLLHGWGQSMQALKPLADLLASDFAVFLIDLPGFGSSVAPPKVWDSARYAQAIQQVLTENGVCRAHVLGHSFGGKVAMRLALSFPALVDKMVLIGSSGVKRQRSLSKRIKMFLIKTLGKALKISAKFADIGSLQDTFNTRFGSVDYKNSKGVMRNILVKSVNEDLSLQISAINAPTLLLWGENDSETPIEMAERLHALLANSQLTKLPGKGHYPFEDSGAHLITRYIAKFLKSTSGLVHE